MAGMELHTLRMLPDLNNSSSRQKNTQINLKWMTPFAQGLRHAYLGRIFTGEWEQFWPDALPATIKDLYGYQR